MRLWSPFLFIASVLGVPLTALMLRVRKVRQGMPAWMAAPDVPLRYRIDDLQHAGRVVNWAAAMVGMKGVCLPRSVFLRLVLRLVGQPSKLCIGVMHEPDDLSAHAWVECNGIAVNDPQQVKGRFSVLA